MEELESVGTLSDTLCQGTEKLIILEAALSLVVKPRAKRDMSSPDTQRTVLLRPGNVKADVSCRIMNCCRQRDQTMYGIDNGRGSRFQDILLKTCPAT